MRVRILLLSVGIVLLCTVLFSLASTQVYYQSVLNENRDYMSAFMDNFSKEEYSLDEEGVLAFSKKCGGARITILSLDGEVIADTATDTPLSNHSGRAEIIQALESGEGFAVRDSSTLGKNYAYYCRAYDGFLVRIAVETQSEWAMFAQVLPTIAMYLSFEIILCLVLAIVATQFILNPVKNLASEAAANDKVTTKYAELEPLADILNERNANINRQMTLLSEEKELVLKARTSKDEFIANVTHEMNTPLTSIKGYAELLNADMLDEEQKKEAYKTVLAQSERLTGLIACIINYSELDNDDLPDYEVDLSALAREMIVTLRPLAEQRKIKLIDKIDENVKIMSRQERITEILGNLIRNAIRYNKDGGSVTVEVTYKRLAVSDTGIGIAKENLDKVFSRFFTVDKSHSGKNGGFGLGLAVVKKICQNSGWLLRVESELSVGSKFIIDF